MRPLRVQITDLIHREKKSRRKCSNISGTNTRWSVLWETEINWGKYYVSRRNVSLGSPTVNFLFIFLSKREHRIDIRYLNHQGDLLRQLFTQVNNVNTLKNIGYSFVCGLSIDTNSGNCISRDWKTVPINGVQLPGKTCFFQEVEGTWDTQ